MEASDEKPTLAASEPQEARALPAAPKLGPRLSQFLGLPSGACTNAPTSLVRRSSRIPVAQAGPVRDLMPWPVPLKRLPMPSEPEPTIPVSKEVHDERVESLKALRRSAAEAGTLVNRVVYDAVHFVPADKTRVPGGGLLFESRFESGNLRRAIYVQTQRLEEGSTIEEYDLLLNWDHGTRGHTQWYLFAVSGAVLAQRYRFNIINFCKSYSLYRQGMRPLVYSARAAERGIGWRRGCDTILYFENGVAKRGGGRGEHSTLSFCWDAAEEADTIYFAYCYPYTYTELCRDLSVHPANCQPRPQHSRMFVGALMEDAVNAVHAITQRAGPSQEDALESDTKRGAVIRRKPLCTTIAGNICEHVLITDFAASEELISSRPVVAISARVHPGESNSSFMMRGIMRFLTGDSIEARALRARVLFLIVPMLNPDGVIVGNYRCSLSACDLNRRWLRPSARHHPTINAFKKLLLRTNAVQPIAMFVDLHGHSRKPNIFMYGCADRGSALLAQVFPLLLSKHSPNSFNFYSCSFSVKKSKECTARVVIHRELDLLTSYTLEASFCGSDLVCRAAAATAAAPPAVEHARSAPDDDAASLAPVAAPSAAESTASGTLRTSGAPATAPPPRPNHFSSVELEAVGHDFCRSLVEFFGIDPHAPTPAALAAEARRRSEEEAERAAAARVEEAKRRQREATMSGVATSAAFNAIQAAAAAARAVICPSTSSPTPLTSCAQVVTWKPHQVTNAEPAASGPSDDHLVLPTRAPSGEPASDTTDYDAERDAFTRTLSLDSRGETSGASAAASHAASRAHQLGASAKLTPNTSAAVLSSCPSMGTMAVGGAAAAQTVALPNSDAVQAALQELLLAGTELLGDSDGSDGGAPSDDGGSGLGMSKKKKKKKKKMGGAKAKGGDGATRRKRDPIKEAAKPTSNDVPKQLRRRASVEAKEAVATAARPKRPGDVVAPAPVAAPADKEKEPAYATSGSSTATSAGQPALELPTPPDVEATAPGNASGNEEVNLQMTDKSSEEWHMLNIEETGNSSSGSSSDSGYDDASRPNRRSSDAYVADDRDGGGEDGGIDNEIPAPSLVASFGAGASAAMNTCGSCDHHGGHLTSAQEDAMRGKLMTISGINLASRPAEIHLRSAAHRGFSVGGLHGNDHSARARSKRGPETDKVAAAAVGWLSGHAVNGGGGAVGALRNGITGSSALMTPPITYGGLLGGGVHGGLTGGGNTATDNFPGSYIGGFPDGTTGSPSHGRRGTAAVGNASYNASGVVGTGSRSGYGSGYASGGGTPIGTKGGFPARRRGSSARPVGRVAQLPFVGAAEDRINSLEEHLFPWREDRNAPNMQAQLAQSHLDAAKRHLSTAIGGNVFAASGTGSDRASIASISLLDPVSLPLTPSRFDSAGAPPGLSRFDSAGASPAFSRFDSAGWPPSLARFDSAGQPPSPSRCDSSDAQTAPSRLDSLGANRFAPHDHENGVACGPMLASRRRPGAVAVDGIDGGLIGGGILGGGGGVGREGSPTRSMPTSPCRGACPEVRWSSGAHMGTGNEVPLPRTLASRGAETMQGGMRPTGVGRPR